MSNLKPMIRATGKSGRIAFARPVSVQAAASAEGGAPSVRRFTIDLYTGEELRVEGFEYPVVLDLATFDTSHQRVPALYDHEPTESGLVGQTDSVVNANGKITVTGRFTPTDAPDDASTRILKRADAGFIWNASIGCDAATYEQIQAGQTIELNNRTYTGPLVVARGAYTVEASFVVIGADRNAYAVVARSSINAKGGAMKPTFEEFVASLGFVASDLDETQAANLKRLYAEKYPDAVEPIDGVSGAGNPPPTEHTPGTTAAARRVAVRANGGTTFGATTASPITQIREETIAESRRVASIHRICAANQGVTIRAGGADVPLIEHAINEGWSADATELYALRASRPTVIASSRSTPAITSRIVEAAIAAAGGLYRNDQARLVRTYGEDTLNQADEHFRGSVRLGEILLMAAQQNGYSGRAAVTGGNLRELIRFACPSAVAVRASGVSTFSLPGILGNSMNKFLLAGYESVDDVWRLVVRVTSVSDFKQRSSHRMTGGFTFEELGPGGEIKHGKVSEQKFTNQARTYATFFVIDRAMWINDDLGALVEVPNEIGRGGAEKLSRVIWTDYLNDATFYAAGNKNLLTGAGSALTPAGLSSAKALFLKQTKQNGAVLAQRPAILLVPPELDDGATVLLRDRELRDNTGNKSYVAANPHAGSNLTKAMSPYLSDATIPGNSATAWYLLGDPAAVPTTEVAFLDGVQQPTIEEAAAEFDQPGLAMRGLFDFGVNKQDHRGGVKSTAA